MTFRPAKPAPRPVVKRNDDYSPSVARSSAAQNKRIDRAADKGGRKPVGGPSNKPSRDARPSGGGRGQQKGDKDKDKGGARKESKVRNIWFLT